MTPPAPPPRRHRSRDPGRAAVYAAENQVARILDRAVDFPVVDIAGSRLTLPPERHFGDLRGVQRYVGAVLALDNVRHRWPGRALVPVTVRERRGAAKAHYEFDTATIAVPVRGADARWALREMVVLHEIAHHLGGPADTGHGAAFEDRLLQLVGDVIGEEVALLLRISLADQAAPTD